MDPHCGLLPPRPPINFYLLSRLLLLSWILAVLPGSANSRAIEDEFDWKALPTRTASQCFNVQGVPVITLRCERGQLIRVLQAFYGVSTPKAEDKGQAQCHYDGQSQPCVQYTDLKESCMGQTECTVAVSNPFLSNCERYAHYMQVNFTCIPRERTRDICEGSEITTWQGYIRSPNYPALYGPSANCRCSLKTQDRSILLQILDFSLNVTSQAEGKCSEDRLRIEGWGDKCNPIVPEGLPETLGLREQALTLKFVTDERYQSRGFWLEFRGSNGGKVTMTCGQAKLSPSIESNRTPDDEGSIKWPDELTDNESTSDFRQTTDNNIVLVDDNALYPTPPREVEGTPPEEVDNEFDTYDFSDQQEYHIYNVGDVQLATGIVVSVLILIAVVIIIVLVFRR